ncbi:MAG: excinuclease ABC subunit UvrC [Nitrososphaerales archaeon]
MSTPLSGFGGLPEKPGIYILKNLEGNPLYVGKASSVRNRVQAHLRPKLDDPVGLTLKDQIAKVDYILTQSPMEALILENVLIKRHKPRYNIRLKDDKSYPFIKVTLGEPVPRVIVTRRIVNDGSRYFGPYGNARAARRTVKYLRKTFPIRSCALPLDGVKKFKSCIDYNMGLCKAPCIFAVSKQEYDKDVKRFQMFLEGKLVQLSKVMYDEMWMASENEEFEKASKIRDEIRSLEITALKQRISFSGQMRDKDILALSRNEKNCVAMIFQVREGNVVGSEKFILDGVGDASSDNEIISAFVKQYYTSEETKARGLPQEIVLPAELEDKTEIGYLINSEAKLGQSLRITSPLANPENLKLIRLAQENADSLVKEQESKDDARKHERLRALKDLKEILNLGKIPRRIECFDISNIHGDEAVGAMTVFTDGFPDKGQYRKFRIKSVKGIDDYSMMAEMIGRRFKRLIETNPTSSGSSPSKVSRWAKAEPDLVIIDGGRGHLNAALEQMREDGIFGIPTVALAKKEELVFLPQKTNPVRLSRDSEALHVLQHIRDQAHRFGVAYHRKLRSRKITLSKLDEVKGIGKKRKRNLLAHFGSVEAMRRSSVEEIAQVGNVSKKLADAILSTLEST